MKTFYASVECAERGLNPFETNLVVADPERGKNALCLAITPKLKAQGIKNRCRMSEIPKSIHYEIAVPRMQLYINYTADIYEIYLQYIDKDDIHVYSIDEAFLDVTDYLRMYNTDAESFAKKLMNEILEKKRIPSTVGIGTNLYLAKIALDITAKHAKTHIGYLDEETYRQTLWHHRPITDFWQVAEGKARRLAKYGFYDMGAVAHAPQDLLQKEFGKDWELLYDHAWGRETCLISDIKSYKSKGHSVSSSQILPRDYDLDEARIVMTEMVINGSQEMMRRHVITNKVGIFVGYSSESHDPTGGTVRMPITTNLSSKIMPYALQVFDQTTIPGIKIRRLGISFESVCDEACEGYDLFTDFDEVEREKKREHAVLDIKDKYGKNAILRATNYMDGATQRERNTFIGGHKA
jgi:DNA polymerase V